MDADIVIEPIADSSPVVYICYSWAMYGEVSLASEFQVETTFLEKWFENSGSRNLVREI